MINLILKILNVGGRNNDEEAEKNRGKPGKR